MVKELLKESVITRDHYNLVRLRLLVLRYILDLIPMQWQCSVRGNPNPEHFEIWLFLDNLSISEQTIDRALTIHRELQNYDSMSMTLTMKKNIFI